MSFELGEGSSKSVENYAINEFNALGSHEWIFKFCLKLPSPASQVDRSFEVFIISDEADPA